MGIAGEKDENFLPSFHPSFLPSFLPSFFVRRVSNRRMHFRGVIWGRKGEHLETGVCRWAAIPPGIGHLLFPRSGGVGALNPRLMAGTPSGVPGVRAGRGLTQRLMDRKENAETRQKGKQMTW